MTGYRMEIGGEREEQVKGFVDLAIVMLISVTMIYLALVFQFKHAIKPFIVFAAIPFGVAGALHHKGFEEFLPLYRSRRRWADRIKELDIPLISGYVFCRFDVQQRLPVVSVSGVLSIVGLGGTPVPVEEHEITNLQRVVDSGFPQQPWPDIPAGQKIVIHKGMREQTTERGLLLGPKT